MTILSCNKFILYLQNHKSEIKEMNLSDQSLGEIVTKDFRSAAILSNAGIDFCCGGDRTLGTACAEKGINSEELIRRLTELETQPVKPGQNFDDWTPDFLCDYIINTHHTFVKRSLPNLVLYTQKIASVHGEHHPGLLEVAELVGKINSELSQHLKNEEEVLFPAIKGALNTKSGVFSSTIHSEISRMHDEHLFAGGAMDRINVITGSYKVPSDGCNTYHVTFQLLKEFEDDLHIHVHLENNILFPKSLKL